MVKDAYWFRHDCNARNDTKMIKLRRLGGLEAVGLYWCVIESLREANAYQLPGFAIADFCFDLRVEETVFQMLFDCDLLILADGMFFSQSLNDRMLSLEEKREKLKKNGRKGGLAKAKQLLSKRQAKQKQLLSEKSRVDQSRVDEIRKVDGGQAPVPPVAKLAKKTKGKPKGGETWDAYSKAFFERYGTAAVRNARTNALCSQLVDRLGGDESPIVAAFYLSSNNSYYVQRGHALQALVGDAEKVRTEWATGRRITQTAAQEADRLQQTGDDWGAVIAEMGE